MRQKKNQPQLKSIWLVRKLNKRFNERWIEVLYAWVKL